MPTRWFYLLLLVPAVPLAGQDFRTRTVGVPWLALLGAASAAVGWMSCGVLMTVLHAAVNAGLLLLVAGALLSCHLARRRPVRAFFRQSFGAGDAAMLAAVAPLFDPVNYLRFVLVSCLAGLGWWAMRRRATIPLAGFMALALAGYALLKTCGVWN